MQKANRKPWLLAGLFATIAISLLGMAGVSAAPTAPTTEGCRPGVYAEIMNDGSWRLCVEATPTTPAPTPSSSPTAEPSPSVSPSPTATASPTPTPTASPTPTVTATPTPTPTQTSGCVADPSACGYPDVETTGARGTLTVVNGNVTLSTAGAVYENKWVKGCIEVKAKNVTIRNVKVTGDCYYSIDYAPYNDFTANNRMIVEDTTVVCANRRGTAIGELNFTARRVDISGCENAFDVDRDVTVVDSYVHNMTDELSGGDPHTDGLQGVQTRNVLVDHSTFIMPKYATSAIISDSSPGGNWVVRNSLLDGGGYTIYCPDSGSITGNRFGTNQWTNRSGAPHNYATGCGGMTWSNNVHDVTGAILPRP